ncbi:proton channel OtopLc isoform X2 [Neocloeon triangulifer]|uniref:proton channel OtopLc isoform X2 n=1 Tax=Neocloeon triangulifer TaxID=2078957 RepID=UPI00286F93B4|nr:proton channel OtopLc isoform X2 [Neocloeon triangulifer]
MGKKKNPEIRIATVEMERGQSEMATLPAGHRGVGTSDEAPEKHNDTNREMEARLESPLKRTSLFIVMSFIYAKLLVVVCIAFQISEVVTHNVPLHYYEAFFTYLYSASILYLLYVFCYLLTGNGRPERRPPPKKKKEKKEKKKEKGADDASSPSQAQKNKGALFQQESYPRKKKHQMRQQPGSSASPPPVVITSGGGRSPDGRGQFGKEGKEGVDSGNETAASPLQEKGSSHDLLEKPRKRKTSESDTGHGSFFLRVGAIAFGLGTMIYNGLEFGSWFEIPQYSDCYSVLRGANPVLQMIFTFMQMYFIFMNSRLNIHRFKVISRFGLMHVVATNICVWIRTLVLESLKEVSAWKIRQGEDGVSEDFMILEGQRLMAKRRGETPDYMANINNFINDLIKTASKQFDSEEGSTFATEDTTVIPATTTQLSYLEAEGFMSIEKNHSDYIHPSNYSCGRINIMGTIVQDSAPYLYPFIIEYSLIGAAVIYVMWSRIGRNPRYMSCDEEEGLMAPVAMVPVRRIDNGRVDCVGASKGLFFGLLLLVGSLICLILFFVLVHHRDLGMLAIYLADVSHCVVLTLALLAIFIGFCRVRSLKFHIDSTNILNDILLRVSAFGLFIYAVFSVIAGSLSAFTHEPNLLVMVTGILVVIEVVFQLLFIADVSRRRVHLPEHERTKPGRQVVTFLLICNITMWVIYTFEVQKVGANPVQLDFYGFLAWAIVQRITLPLCIFHRFHSAVAFAEIWKTSYKPRLE